ncbi:MAG: hypothetical protein ACE5JB_00945 [bacterium]
MNSYEEKISIHAFNSSGDLKIEIRKRIMSRKKINWKIDQIFSQGPYIYLLFKKEVTR